jgi:hypothetical protein
MLRNWRTWAIFLALLVMVLAGVVVVQALMLRSRGWTIPLGNVAEWVAGIGTMAAFGALFFAAQEWRSGQEERRSLELERQKAEAERRALAETREAERRDNEMNQARLIIVQPAPYEDRTFGGSDPPSPAYREVVIQNHSGVPIFNLHIQVNPGGGDVHVLQNFAGGSGRPADMEVLSPDAATAELTVVGGDGETPSTEFIEFTFTDARGVRWRRRGSDQPVRVTSK